VKMTLKLNTKYLLAAVALALGGPAMAQQAGATYEARAQVSGFLLRAAMVCREQNDWRAMAETGVRLLAGPMRPITNSYPATVKAWGTEGANLFNTAVMQDGADVACAEAARDVVQARAIVARDR
jgi:hypothetical protein